MFVRTKDEILKVLDVDFGKETKTKIYQTATKMFTAKLVLKEAYTIEELCDRFVLLERNLKPRIFETLKGAINNKIYDDEVIYGAIWTDKGLIYVAKMNENGEFELI